MGEPVAGKFLLEILTKGMYSNPTFKSMVRKEKLRSVIMAAVFLLKRPEKPC